MRQLGREDDRSSECDTCGIDSYFASYYLGDLRQFTKLSESRFSHL